MDGKLKQIGEVEMNKKEAIERINKPRKDKITGEEVKPINSYFTSDLDEPTEDSYVTKAEIDMYDRLCLPEKLLSEMGWKAGDEIEVSKTENCFDWGEVKSLVLRNLSKEK